MHPQPHLDDLIGKPFVDGGRGPDFYDCWGLASEVFRRFGIVIPDYRVGALDQTAIFNAYRQYQGAWRELAPGDFPVPCLIFMKFNSPVGNHVGVYIGGERFIHARAKTCSCIERLDHPYWKNAVIGYYLPR